MLAAATFVPFQFVHPFRVPRWRLLNIAALVLWGLLALVALAQNLHPPGWVGAALSAIAIYFVIAGLLAHGRLIPCTVAVTTYDRAPFHVRRDKERTMVAAVRVHKVGGPEVLTYEEIDVPAPGAGQIRVKQHACGVNFVDIYFRIGPLPGAGRPAVRRRQ